MESGTASAGGCISLGSSSLGSLALSPQAYMHTITAAKKVALNITLILIIESNCLPSITAVAERRRCVVRKTGTLFARSGNIAEACF
jgi:hypothetical protein